MDQIRYAWCSLDKVFPVCIPKIHFAGPQWFGMGRELYLTQDYMREMCDDFASIFEQFNMDWDLRDEMSKMSVEDSHLDQTRIAQVLLFLFEVPWLQKNVLTLQVSIAKFWMHLGLEVNCVLGHSLGEIPAAVIAGALPMEEACRLIYERANIMQEGVRLFHFMK